MRKILLFVGLQLAVFGLAGLKAQDAGLAAREGAGGCPSGQ